MCVYILVLFAAYLLLSMRSYAWPFELVLLYNGSDAVLNWICAVVTYAYQQRGQSVQNEGQNYESSEGILRDLYHTYFTSSSTTATTTTSSSTSAVYGEALGACHIHSSSWLDCSSSLPPYTTVPTPTVTLLSEPSVYAVISPLTLLYRLITCGLVIEAQFYLQNLSSLPPLSTLIQTSEGEGKGNNGFRAEDHESAAMTCSVSVAELIREIQRYRPYLSQHTPRIHNNVDSDATTTTSNTIVYDEAYIESICLKILSAYTS